MEAKGGVWGKFKSRCRSGPCGGPDQSCPLTRAWAKDRTFSLPCVKARKGRSHRGLGTFFVRRDAVNVFNGGNANPHPLLEQFREMPPGVPCTARARTAPQCWLCPLDVARGHGFVQTLTVAQSLNRFSLLCRNRAPVSECPNAAVSTFEFF